MTPAPALSEVVSDPPAVHDVRGVLHISAFRRLWIALSFSSLGDWLGLLATTTLARQLVRSYAGGLYAIGGVLTVRLLPALLIGPVAGAFADRFNRRTTMVTADVIRFSLFMSIPLVRNLPWLLGASFLIECVSLFWLPAKEASVPNLVPRERLEAANQISLVTTYGSAAVAAVVFSLLSLVNSALATGFVFFKTNSVDLALYFDASTFLFSALTIFQLREISSARRRGGDGEAPELGFFRSITEGWAFIGSARWLRGLVVGILGAVVAGAAMIALAQPFVTVELRGGNAAFGVMFAMLFLGLASGMFVGPRMLSGLSRRRLMGLSITAAGVALALDALSPNLLIAIGFTALVGAFAGITWVVGLTLVGLEVSDDKRGRTFSFIYNLMRVDMLLVLAAAPFIAGTIGRHPVHLFSVVLRFDGVTITLFGAGLVAILVGVACQRLMDDHTGPHLRTELWAALRREAAGTGRPVGHGLLVAFEGGEGSGKSTQVALLARWLDERGFDVVVTREPGATVIGARLRGLLLDRGTAGLAARAEALLYAADRAQHVAELIRPALDRGAVVLSDRYVDSSLAYQGAGRALEVAELARLSRWATGGLAADLTVVLDIDPVVGLGRVSGTGDRIEDESVEFHTRVRSAFLALAHRHQRRYLVLDAGQQVEEVQARIRERIERALPTIRTPQRSPIGVPDQ